MFCANSSLAQNIIPNGNLEDTIQKNFGLKFAKEWDSPTNGSPDYLTNFHIVDFGAPDNFAGFQEAKSGIAYLGIITFFSNGLAREYIQNKLIRSLQKDSSYCFQMYVSLADSMNYATKNSLGVYFSETAINSTTRVNLPFTPYLEVDSTFNIDKTNWVKVGGSFVANGNEEYLIIGNFNDNSNTDTSFVDGGGNDPMFQAAYYYIDNVFLGHCDSLPVDTSIGLRENSLKDKLNVYPNPFEGRVVVNYEGNQSLNFILYNLLGKEVIVSPTGTINNRYALDLGDLPKGIYFLSVSDGVNRVTKKLIKQ